MIRETITFKFKDETQRKAFHAILKRRLAERDLVAGWDAAADVLHPATHLQAMMDEADDLSSAMNNAGFKFLGHLATDERARVSLAFSAMVMDYAKRHGIDVTNPTEAW